jgi:hypothetical protein
MRIHTYDVMTHTYDMMHTLHMTLRIPEFPPSLLLVVVPPPLHTPCRYYGCGTPLPAGIFGLRVLDLGSGTGRDCYVAARMVCRHPQYSVQSLRLI